MSDLFGNPEDRFSRVAAQMILSKTGKMNCAKFQKCTVTQLIFAAIEFRDLVSMRSSVPIYFRGFRKVKVLRILMQSEPGNPHYENLPMQ